MNISLSGRLVEIRYRDVAVPTLDFLALARETGYDGVELRATQVADRADAPEAQAIGRGLAQHRLRLTRLLTLGVNEETWERFEAYVEVARALGAESVGIWVQDVAWTRRACDHLGEAGLPLVLQTHSGEFIGTPEDCLAFHAAVGRRNLRFMYDPAHFYLARKPYGEPAVRRMADVIHCGGFQKIGAETGPDGKWRSFRLDWDDPRGVRFEPVIAAFRAVGMDNHITVIEPYEERQDARARAAGYARKLRALLG